MSGSMEEATKEYFAFKRDNLKKGEYLLPPGRIFICQKIAQMHEVEWEELVGKVKDIEDNTH